MTFSLLASAPAPVRVVVKPVPDEPRRDPVHHTVSYPGLMLIIGLLFAVATAAIVSLLSPTDG